MILDFSICKTLMLKDRMPDTTVRQMLVRTSFFLLLFDFSFLFSAVFQTLKIMTVLNGIVT